MFNRFCFGALLLAGLVLPITSCSNSPSLTSIVVSPSTMNFGGAGLTTQLTATGYYTHPNHPAETKNITDEVTWASSTPECVTVSSTGFITSGHNTCTDIPVTASAPGFNGLISGSMTVNVTQSSTGGGGGSSTDIASLTIIPSSQTVASVGQTGQFIAIGTTGAGTTENLSSSAVWTSSSTAVATVCSAGSAAPCTASTDGLATATGAGTTTITAVYANADGTSATGTATFTVTGASTAPLQSLGITPGTETILQGQSSQLIAIGTFSSTSSTPGTQNLTSQVTWNSSNTSVASITSGGLVSAVGAGTAVITAIAPAVDGSLVAVATITVTTPTSGSTAEPLTSLAILPAAQTVAGVGQTTNFIALGTFSSTSSTPGTQNMANISTYTVAWSSSVPSVATINANGVATAVGQGTTAITAIATNNADKSASYATATLTVTASSSPSQVASLAIIPSSQTVTMPLTTTTPTTPTTSFVAIGTIGSTGLQVNETNSASWTSSNEAVATINQSTGAVTLVGQGTTTITALYNNPSTSTTPASVVTATATLAVNGVESEPLLSVAILPSNQSISYTGQTSQLIAIGTFSAAPVTQNLTNSTAYPIKWSSSNSAVATVCTTGSPAPCTASTNGLVTAVGQGTAAITVIASNTDGSVVTGVATITVTNGAAEQITAVTIIPSSLSLSATGQPGQFVALGTSGTTGLLEDVTNSPQLAWTSSIPAYATVCTVAVGSTPAFCPTTPGQAQGVSSGATNITAEFTNPATASTAASVVTAQASVSVTTTPAAEPLLSIAVEPSSTTDQNLEGNAQFLAYGTFSTAPTLLDITNGFFHSGFPGASCTAAYASADAATAAADAAANLPLTNLPYAQCSFVPVNWISTAPFDFPINSAGAAGATGGLATADASGNTDIYAVAANPDGTLVYSTTSSGMATFNCPYAAPTYGTTTVTLPNGTTTTTTDYSDLLNPGTCNTLTVADSLLSTLTVFNASTTSTGLNQSNWLITALSATSTASNPVTVIHCGPGSISGGSVCEATYPNGTPVTLTAPTETGVNFGGWSSNCTPVGTVTAAGPNSCTVVVGGDCTLNVNTGTYTCTNSSNVTVGAIFN
jgi:hypothetical protein